jgi:glycosyltransferase involved in cell wall biosynthesis
VRYELELSKSGPAADAAPVALFLGADADYMYSFRAPVMHELQRLGYRVLVVATKRPGFRGDVYERSNIELLDWPINKSSFDVLADLSALLALFRLLRETKPALFFAHTIKPVIYGVPIARLAKAARVTVMIPGLGYAFAERGAWKQSVARALAELGYRHALNGANLVLFQNPDDRRLLVESKVLKSGTPVAIVNGSGVDMDHFARAPLPSGPPTFLMVSRLLREKGVGEFVEAARVVKRKVPEARFVLVGGADEVPTAIPRDEIQRWIAEGIIEVRGKLADPREAYAACHVFVLPSYYREGCPRVNLEAMATGRAIITTDWVGCRETVVHGVNGLLVPTRDVAALAEAMVQLAQDPERVAAMGEQSWKMCLQKFDLAKVCRQTARLLVG